MFNVFKNLFSAKEIKTEPLFLAPSAREKILQQIASRPAGVDSIFEIRIDFKKDSYNVKVGFVEKKECTTIFQYPIPIMIGKTEEYFLQNFSLEYDEAKGNFYIYPDVKITVDETPNPKILRMEINRPVLHEDSEVSKISMDKNTAAAHKIKLLDKIFSLGFVESIHIEKNSLSVEFETPPLSRTEEDTVDTILKYFTDLGYPLGIKNGTLVTFIPGEENFF